MMIRLSETKILFTLLLIFGIFFLPGCNTGKKSDEIKNYSWQEEKALLNPELQARLGSWVEEGTVCWGLVVTVDKNGTIHRGLPVKAKVISFQKDSIKMKALEMVNLAQIKGCTKMGLAKGETWWEEDGDLFKTKEEAVSYLRRKGWLE